MVHLADGVACPAYFTAEFHRLLQRITAILSLQLIIIAIITGRVNTVQLCKFSWQTWFIVHLSRRRMGRILIFTAPRGRTSFHVPSEMTIPDELRIHCLCSTHMMTIVVAMMMTTRDIMQLRFRNQMTRLFILQLVPSSIVLSHIKNNQLPWVVICQNANIS